MSDVRIREARQADIACLASLKSDYVRTLYRGLVPPETLRAATAAEYEPQIANWLVAGLYDVTLMERDGKPAAFIVHNEDITQPGTGLIYEMVCDHLCTMDEKYLLLDHILDGMHKQGHSEAHVWILRDNFRARFLVENHDFRIDGTRDVVLLHGQEYSIARYTYLFR